MAMGMFIFVTVMLSLISVMNPLLVCFSFLCEICFLYCDDNRLGAVYEFF